MIANKSKQGMHGMTYDGSKDGCSLFDTLDPKRARKLRADAWRYVRKINSVTARRIWRAVRNREIPMRRAA